MTSSTSDKSSAPGNESAYGGFDASDMKIVHRVFRREIPLMIDLIGAVAPGDVTRSRILADHFADLRIGLINHHEGEDELLWPLMIARMGPEREVVQRMEAEHERIVETIDAVDALMARWAPTADAETRDRLVAALDEHRAVILEHLDDEETHLLPLAERFLTAKEWGALGEHFVMSSPKTKLLKLFGMVMEDAGEDGRAILLAGMPAPVRLVWHVVGRPMYDRTVRRVRGTAA